MEEKLMPSGGDSQKITIEALSKEEIIQKYKGLLGIAKKAKQFKDELFEENRKLKEKLLCFETQKDADKTALLTMQELVDEFTSNKLKMATEISELHKQHKLDNEALDQLRIQKESLQRQLDSVSQDNESLLNEIESMEYQLKQVNLIGIEQKEHLGMLELEVNKLKDTESQTVALQNQVAESLAEVKTLKENENIAKKAHDELMELYMSAKETNKEQRKKFNALKDRFVDVYRQVKKLKECKRILLETQHEYSDAVSKWQKEIIEASRLLCSQLNELKNENEELKHKLEQQSGECQNGSINVERVALKLVEFQALNDLAIHEQTETHLRLESLLKENNNLRVSLEEMHEIKRTLEEKCKHEAQVLSTNINELENEKSAYITKLQQMETLNGELMSKINVHSENLDQERNVLISKLEKENLQLLTQIQDHKSKTNPNDIESTLQTDLLSCRQSHEDLILRYEQKEREHADLLGEMRELNEALKARGDVISRQQERQQELVTELKRNTTKLKQIEDKLSEKEQSLAHKESQMIDIGREVDESRQRVADMQAICTQNEEQVRMLSEELQNLRCADTDAATVSFTDAQSDILSTSTFSRGEELSRLREVDDSFEEKYNKLRGLAVRLKKKLQEQQSNVVKIEQLQSSNIMLKKELEDCRQQIMLLQTEQSQTQNLLETLKAENKKLQTSRKQANVLNLEIEAAEKSLSDVTSKMAAKIAEIETLNEALNSRGNTIEQLRKEMAILESAKAAECIHSQELKQQIDRLQSQIKDAVHAKQSALVNSKELEHSLEQEKRNTEELQLELAKTTNKHKELLMAATTDKEQLERKLMATEEELKTVRHTLKTAERTLDDLRVEHLAYKVKAQAVLRKNQSKDMSRELELDEELVSLRSTEQELRANIKVLEKQFEMSEKNIEQLREHSEALQHRNNELINILEELRNQNERLSESERSTMQFQQEALRKHRLQIKNLEALHKEQLQNLEKSHKQHLDQLQVQLDKTDTRAPTAFSAEILNISNEQSKIDFLLMEREDAEGSEEAAETALVNAAANRKISNASRRSQHDFMPLDELLNAPMQVISDAVKTIKHGGVDNDGDTSIESVHFELQTTKERLQIQESRVRHLTVLLTENEQDLAKLSQLNEMLKEELRRQERSEQREKHMHNSEYLKNVILKFLTLSNGDERARLVPVLNTILKLSRTETEMLNCAVKGQRETTNRGWGNFLPTWGGGGGNNNNNNNNNNN